MSKVFPRQRHSFIFVHLRSFQNNKESKVLPLFTITKAFNQIPIKRRAPSIFQFISKQERHRCSFILFKTEAAPSCSIKHISIISDLIAKHRKLFNDIELPYQKHNFQNSTEDFSSISQAPLTKAPLRLSRKYKFNFFILDQLHLSFSCFLPLKLRQNINTSNQETLRRQSNSKPWSKHVRA